MSLLTTTEEDFSEDEDSAEDFGSALLELPVPEDLASVSDEDVLSAADEDGLSVVDEDGLSVVDEDGLSAVDEEDFLVPAASLEDETLLLEDSSEVHALLWHV